MILYLNFSIKEIQYIDENTQQVGNHLWTEESSYTQF